MHCPKCNTELPAGKVYCPKCGQEVQIVPDYDPLDEVLWDGQEKKETSDRKTDRSGEEADKRKSKNTLSYYLYKWWKDPLLRNISLIGLLLILCVGVAITAYVLVRRQNNYGYQIRQGLACYENKNLEEAILYLKRALELQDEETKEDERPLLYLARIYRELGESELAGELLEKLLDYPMGEKQKLELYDELFHVLQENGKSDRINGLIDICQDELIQKRLQPYRIAKPTVNLDGGTYYHYIYPKLEAAYGTIYYTLDGSFPTTESTKYTGRIELQEGDNILTAVAINEKGIVSDQLFEVYTLDFSRSMDGSNKNDGN